jgi:hypothetical protein
VCASYVVNLSIQAASSIIFQVVTSTTPFGLTCCRIGSGNCCGLDSESPGTRVSGWGGGSPGHIFISGGSGGLCLQKIVPEEEVQDVYSLEMEAANFVYQKWRRRRSWNSNTRRGRSRPCSDINKWSWFCPSSPS